MEKVRVIALLGLLFLGEIYCGNAKFFFVSDAISRGAVCLDGSPAAYNLQQGFGSGANNWLLFLPGGAWCRSTEECLIRSKTDLGSSKNFNTTSDFEGEGILSNVKEENIDFFNWNKALLYYCDGSSFTGDNQNKSARLFYRGRQIWFAVIQDLMSKGLGNADKAFLAGSSAGGLATIIHCDEFQELLPISTSVKCMSDAGFFLDVADIHGKYTWRNKTEKTVILQGSEKHLAESCSNKTNPVLCFIAQYLINNMKTPLFILNSAYDFAQIETIFFGGDRLWRPCGENYTLCTKQQINTLAGYRNEMLQLLKTFSMEKKNGLFINSCFTHGQSVDKNYWSGIVQLRNKTIAEAVGDWYYDRAETILIDDPYPSKSSICINTTPS